MTNDPNSLDEVVKGLAAEIAAIRKDAPEAAAAAEPFRDPFLELLVLCLGNLYGKIPLPSSLFDRAMLRAVSAHLSDSDAGQLATRTEDWIRLEGLVRVMDGQKSYTLNRPAFAALSTRTDRGSLGEVMERIASCYVRQQPTPELRRLTRELASYFMTRLGRS